jgi:membrane protein implicated in regulation of membrane protease activity
MWQIWLIIAGVCLIIEIITTGFLVFWFSIGSLFAMIVSLFTDNIIIQTTVFVISSTILIFATKPFLKKFAKHDNTIKTNVYSIIGKTGIVVADIDPINSTGQIKVDGEVWSAISDKDISIPKGTEVEIKEIKGVKAIVSPIKLNV